MTAAGRKPSRRYSRESQQEDRSEGQIKERFAELGWPCDRVGRDLGEDLRVRIFDEGQSTGLEFYVQLKSAANAERLKKKKSPALGYRLEVAALEHWEVSTTLVVLVVWDVEKRVGWWRPVPEIIKELDEASKDWRKRITVTATVPLANATDDAGFVRLRRVVANHSLPLVPKEKPTSFSLVFDGTEGAAALRAFEKAIDMGESITLSGDLAPRIEFPAWHRRIYGTQHQRRPVKFEFTPTPTKAIKVLRVEASSSEGTVAVPYVEMRATIQGRKRLVLTNEHQMLPIAFTIELSDSNASLTFQQVRRGDTVHQAREATTFLLTAGAPNGITRVIDPESGKLLLSIPTSRSSVTYDLAELRRWLTILDKLSYIQQRIGQYGMLSLRDLDKDPAEELHTINSLFAILRDGRREATQSFSFEVAPVDQEMPRTKGDVHINQKGVRARILNLDIPLGDVRSTIVDGERFLDAIFAARREAMATGKPAPVRLDDIRVVEEYVDLLRGEEPWGTHEVLDRLAGRSMTTEGYFTRADVRAAGASDAVLDALLVEKKAEEVADDIYHFTHFPHADREDLVVLWLQTDRRGVISHETALHLHDLCDILPSNLHVTVPPGWTPRDRQLAADVEIRYGEVPEADLRWLGPVPYTGPLRTVRDCIEVGVSPELIEQAVAEGIRRGLFTEADFPQLRRAESA
jgi:hypothetical protein